MLVSFFGTGNIASISSFDPNWVRCLVSTFAPFLMASLIILKLMIPVLVVMCAVWQIHSITKVSIWLSVRLAAVIIQWKSDVALSVFFFFFHRPFDYFGIELLFCKQRQIHAMLQRKNNTKQWHSYNALIVQTHCICQCVTTVYDNYYPPFSFFFRSRSINFSSSFYCAAT